MAATVRKPKDKITSLRAHQPLLRRVDRAAKKLGVTRNGFIVLAITELVDTVLPAKAA